MTQTEHSAVAGTIVRIVACGSVDDGKSTLVGRLLRESGCIPEDELDALAAASVRHGTRNGELDDALLFDGLEAEREQGITIDVAWRHLRTPKRRFLVADCPGHVQYTRNMATGASTADVALVLVDATKGLLDQTFEHTVIASLFGVRHVVLAVNKMDRVEYAVSVFESIAHAYRRYTEKLGISSVLVVPIVATLGENVIGPSPGMRWYSGPTLLEHLEQLQQEPLPEDAPFRLAIQGVHRDGAGARWLTGTVASGCVRVGDRLDVAPAGTSATVDSLLEVGAPVEIARAGQAIALKLREDVDASRGHVLGSSDVPLASSDQFSADLLWFAQSPLMPGRRYLLKMGTRRSGARIGQLKHRLAAETLMPLAAKRLEFNQIGRVELALDEVVAFEPYIQNRQLGGFIVIDAVTGDTLGCGMIRHGLRRAGNLRWHHLDVDRSARAAHKGQRPRCVWFTGLSGAGKSTIANLVERGLHERGLHTYLLDGDNVRHGLNRDLGFTEEDRVENIRRVAEVARLMTDAGLVVLVGLISPFRADRAAARARFDDGEFMEVFVDTSLAEAERRDRKGLYAMARSGQLPNFTGIDSPYEPPEHPELVLDTQTASAEELALAVIDYILR